jgi:Na+-translocating ferredoxin:NAD+ oxidoreductase RnfE subunit
LLSDDSLPLVPAVRAVGAPISLSLIGRVEAFASKNRLDRALLDGDAMGLGCTVVLIATTREMML